MSLFYMVFASLTGTYFTYSLIHKWKMNSVRASALSAFLFVIFSSFFPIPLLVSLQPVFLGGTFVAMTETHRLSERKVFFASFLFAMIFFWIRQLELLRFHGGNIGGAIGGTAFVACLIVYGGQKLIPAFAHFFSIFLSSDSDVI